MGPGSWIVVPVGVGRSLVVFVAVVVAVVELRWMSSIKSPHKCCNATLSVTDPFADTIRPANLLHSHRLPNLARNRACASSSPTVGDESIP